MSDDPIDIAELFAADAVAGGVPCDPDIDAAIAAVLRCWLAEDKA